MADKVGDVYYEAHIRGDDLPREARKLGTAAGTQMGKSANQGFKSQFSNLSKELIPELRRQGRLSGDAFTQSFENSVVGRFQAIMDDVSDIFSRRGGLDEFASRFDRVDDAISVMRSKLKELNQEGLLNDQMWNRLGGTLNQWAGSARRAELQSAELAAHEEEHRRSLDKTNEALQRNSKEIDKNGLVIERGSRRLRRWQVITLLVASALPEIVTLSSAVGGAIAVLGGALASGVAGIGVAVAAFKGLNGELKDLPANVRPAAEAFKGFKESLGGLQDTIQGAAAEGLRAGFSSLTETVKALDPVFRSFGALVGQIFEQIAASIAPGTEGFEKLKFFLEASQPIFASLVDAAMSLTGALGGIFLTAAPFIQAFADKLAIVLETFNQWTTSFTGKNQLAEWFQNAETIFGGLIEVAVALGQTLADVVTPSMVESFTNFLTQLAGFMPAVTALIKVIEDLGIFDVLGAIFEALGPTIVALSPVLQRLASALGTTLVDAITRLAPVFLDLAHALTPLIDALVPILPLIVDLAAQLIEALAPALQPLIDLFVQLLPPILSIVTVLIDALMPLIEPLATLITELLKLGLDPLVKIFEVLAVVLEAVSPLLTLFAEITGAVIGTIVALMEGDFQKIGKIWEDLWVGAQDLLRPIAAWIISTWKGVSSFFSDLFRNVSRGWDQFWKGLERTVKDIWNGILGFIEGGINGFLGMINDLIRGINSANIPGIHLEVIPKVRIPRLAAGALAMKPTLAQIGERGPEAVVPLRRPLSQVDPSVRGLSAVAQGLAEPTKVVNIEAGAFQIVTPAENPAIVASMVMDRAIVRALN